MDALDQSRQAAARIAAEVLKPLAARTDAEGRWPQESFDALKSAGLAGLTVPQQWGGLGQGGTGLYLACEELGTACASSAICFGMHCVGSAVIAANVQRQQGERYLEPIARGEHITTLALSEPGTGAFFYFPQTEIREQSDGDYQVSGNKCFVTNGSYADSYVISGIEYDQNGERMDFSCMILDAESPGMKWQGPWQGLGMRGNSSIQLALENVPVPAQNLLGGVGDQVWYVFNVVAPYFLLAMAGTYAGVARHALQLAIEHVRDRDYAHSGSTLSDSPVIQHRLGEMWARVDRARQLTRTAAQDFDAGRSDALPRLLSAKAEVAEVVVETVNQAMTLCGGIGYRSGSELHQLLRDARAAHVMAPTTDLLRIWTGRALLGKSLLAP